MGKIKSVLILNGPNLNLLGQREPEIYGYETLADVEKQCKQLGKQLGLKIYCAQSNGEGELINLVQGARKKRDAILINPGGYSHTSVALRDALSAAEMPIYEIHISNIHRREPFRHHSYISAIAEGVICGLGTQGYLLALRAIAKRLSK